ncbi:hypothetical protein GCM10023205_04520 [Yinghuangia aomiensis]|uniref:DUF317 domain-containing protein n=1 Tax=Yinghuangia aomiensis TaxID=676205 RepID=A0ABP9GLT1_9ACTN
MTATAHRAGLHQGNRPVDSVRTVIETLARHRWHASEEDGTFFFASPCLRVTVGLALGHEGEREREFAVWSVCGFDPDAVDSPAWVVEFGPATPVRVVLGCIEYTGGALASGWQLSLSPGGFYDKAVSVLERGWQRRVHSTPQAYKGASLFHMAVTDPGQTMCVEHLRDGWEMSLGDRGTWRMTGPDPGTDLRWEALAYATTPLPVIAACTQAMAELAPRLACRSHATPQRERPRRANGQRHGGCVSPTRSLTRTSPVPSPARSMPAAQPRPAVQQLLTTLEGLRHALRTLSPHRRRSRAGQRARKASLPGR